MKEKNKDRKNKVLIYDAITITSYTSNYNFFKKAEIIKIVEPLTLP